MYVHIYIYIYITHTHTHTYFSFFSICFKLFQYILEYISMILVSCLHSIFSNREAPHLQLRVQALHALPAALPAWQGLGQVLLELRLPVVAFGLRWITSGPRGMSWVGLKEKLQETIDFPMKNRSFLYFFPQTNQLKDGMVMGW